MVMLLENYLIKMNVCKFVPYTNPHFWTDRNQTLHTSPPSSGRDRRACMGPQYFTFPTFSAYFVGSGCPLLRSTWLSAPHYPLLRYIRDAACAGVTSSTVCRAMQTRRSARNACVWKWERAETGSKWLMICTCVTNELHFQLHCISTNYNVKTINLRPSFLRFLPTYNTSLYILRLPCRSSDLFR